jgi:hypothetical protein
MPPTSLRDARAAEAQAFFGERRLAAITAADVRRYVAELVACERYSSKTINNSLVVLRLALGHAEKDGLIARNPAASKPGHRDRIKLPAEHREMDYLRLEEIPCYLSGCSETYRPLADLLIATGLRISEALALTPSPSVRCPATAEREEEEPRPSRAVPHSAPRDNTASIGMRDGRRCPFPCKRHSHDPPSSLPLGTRSSH